MGGINQDKKLIKIICRQSDRDPKVCKMSSSFVKRHRQGISRSLAVAAALSAAAALLLLLPPVQDMLMGAATLAKGHALRKPWKWLGLLHAAAYLSFLLSALLIVASFCSARMDSVAPEMRKHKAVLQNAGLYLILFVILVMHAPEDFFTPYLWCEDGCILISGAVYEGIGLLLTVHNGVFWLAQKLLGLLAHSLVSKDCHVETEFSGEILPLPSKTVILLKQLSTMR